MSDPYGAAAIRKGLLNFASGKLGSAVLTIAILLLLVRIMALADYGKYVAVVAMLEVGFAIGGLGLQWVAAGELPPLLAAGHRKAAADKGLAVLTVQLAALALLAGIMLIASSSVARWLALDISMAAYITFACLLVLEGSGRFSRDAINSALMLQRESRISIVCRQAIFLTALLVSVMMNVAATLDWVLFCELAAAGFAAAYGYWNLYSLRRSQDASKSAAVLPKSTRSFREQFALSCRMYAAHLISAFTGPQLLVAALQRFSGPESVAIFGFVRAVYEQASRYLPATLLFSLVRPKMVQTFNSSSNESRVERLLSLANLVGKLNIFVLLPIVAVAFCAGGEAISILSGQKISGAGETFVFLLLGLVPYSQRHILESIAVILGKDHYCLRAALIFPPIAAVAVYAIYMGVGSAGAAIFFTVSQWSFVLILGGALGVAVGYRPDWVNLGKLVGTAVFAGCCAYAVRLTLVHFNAVSAPLLMLTVLGLIVVGLYLTLSLYWKAFTEAERVRINSFLGKRVFLW